MTRIGTVFMVLLFVPSLVLAQSGGAVRRGTGKEADWNAVGAKSGPSGPTISSKDFQEKSIYHLYLDKKKDLKLTEAQVSAFKDADVKLNEANAARFTLLDSLKREAKPRTSGDPSAEEMARLALTRDALNGVVGEIRASYDEAARASVTGMDEPQQKTAQDLMAKYTEEIEKMLREKAGARSGPGGADGKVPVRRGGK